MDMSLRFGGPDDAWSPGPSQTCYPWRSAEGTAMITVGPFQRVYDPTDGRDTLWYINDHCFARGDDGLWHLFGITHEEPANPQDERFLAHATAPDLPGPWTSHPPLMPYDPACSE